MSGTEPKVVRCRDGRSKNARRWHVLHKRFLNEIGLEPHRLSEGQRQMIAALVDVALAMEIARERTVSHEPVDPLAVSRLARTFRMLSTQLGIET